jgi:hypothetical protein
VTVLSTNSVHKITGVSKHFVKVELHEINFLFVFLYLLMR